MSRRRAKDKKQNEDDESNNDMLRELQSGCRERFALIDQGLTRIAEVEASRLADQEGHVPDKRGQSRPGSAFVVGGDGDGDGEVNPEDRDNKQEQVNASRRSAREEKEKEKKEKETEKKKKSSKESGRKRGKANKPVEEVPAVVQDPLEVEKARLVEERERLAEEYAVLESVDVIELCNSEGNPLNLQGRAEEYAYNVVKPAEQYSIATMSKEAEPQYVTVSVPCLEHSFELKPIPMPIQSKNV